MVVDYCKCYCNLSTSSVFLAQVRNIIAEILRNQYISSLRPSQKRVYSERFRAIPIEGHKFLSIRYILV